MIEEFRKDMSDKFDNPNTGVYARLDKIDNKQAVANGRTSKLEMKYWLAMGGFTVIMTVGALFARLYIQDIVRTSQAEFKEDLLQDIESIEEIK